MTDEPVELDADDESPVCPHCIEPIERFDHLCPHCGKPVTAHASMDPLGQVFSQGRAYQNATTCPPSKIVLLGMWLIFGLPVVMALGCGGFTLWQASNPQTHPSPYTAVKIGEVASGPANSPFALQVLSVVGLITTLTVITTILYKVTRNYFSHRDTTDDAVAPED